MEFLIPKLAKMEDENLDKPPEINAGKHHPLWPGHQMSQPILFGIRSGRLQNIQNSKTSNKYQLLGPFIAEGV